GSNDDLYFAIREQQDDATTGSAGRSGWVVVQDVVSTTGPASTAEKHLHERFVAVHCAGESTARVLRIGARRAVTGAAAGHPVAGALTVAKATATCASIGGSSVGSQTGKGFTLLPG